MSSRKPVPPLILWLTALTAAAPVLVVAAVAATRFGGVSLAVAYDLLTWTVARGLGWGALAAAVAERMPLTITGSRVCARSQASSSQDGAWMARAVPKSMCRSMRSV